MRGVWLMKDVWCRKWNAWGVADEGHVVQEVGQWNAWFRVFPIFFDLI